MPVVQSASTASDPRPDVTNVLPAAASSFPQQGATVQAPRPAASSQRAAANVVPPTPASAHAASNRVDSRRAVTPSTYTAAAGGGGQRGGNGGNGGGGRGGNEVAPNHSGEPRAPRRRSILPKLLIALGVILLLVAGGIFVHALLGYRQAEETYAGLAEYAPVSDSENSGIPVVDFDSLKAINPDVVGWIYVPGTSINYPVVQGEDNTHYLTHLFDDTPNSSGSIFLDADATAPGMVDQQTPLYGHHMNNRSMFYEIDDTVDQAAFDAITDVYYITPDATYHCTPLMTCVIDETLVEARQGNFTGDETLADYLGKLRGYVRAEADDVEERLHSAEKVLTLITCSGELPGPDRTVMVLTVDESIPNAGAAAANAGDAAPAVADQTAADAAAADASTDADA